VGCFQSQVAGAGPQLEFIIPLTTERQGYLNLKSYWEFRQSEPARRLERLGRIRDLAGSTDAEHGAEANAHEITAFCSVASARSRQESEAKSRRYSCCANCRIGVAHRTIDDRLTASKH
jgi:hypothetical protein